MGDLLFSFSGRIGRLGYFISLLCVAIAISIILTLQALLGSWQFGSILVVAAYALPAIIYLASTVKRFQDRGRHPLLGFLFYYVLPAGLMIALVQIFGSDALQQHAIQEAVSALRGTGQMEGKQIAILAIPALSGILFFIGQFSLFLLRGSDEPNVFDANSELGLASQ